MSRKFANVVSMLAMMIALGGTSYAASTLAKNSVGTKQIKIAGVKKSDLGAGVVTTAKVRDGSLLEQDFQPGQLPAGPAGPTGPTGPAGPAGSTGATGTIGAVVARSFTVAADLGANEKKSIDAFCKDGEQAIGGGGRGDGNNSELTKVTSSRPAKSTTDLEPPADGTGFNGWRMTVKNDGANPNIRPTVWVLCAAAPTV